MAGLVPAISLRLVPHRVPRRDCRDKSGDDSESDGFRKSSTHPTNCEPILPPLKYNVFTNNRGYGRRLARNVDALREFQFHECADLRLRVKRWSGAKTHFPGARMA
jgi:hypothetical protein